VCVIAPLSAHTLAKLAHGFCDDTLSCIVRAWDFGHYGRNTDESNGDKFHAGKPIILVPAMNTAMWEHPLTTKQLNQIESFGMTANKHNNCDVGRKDSRVHIIQPQTKVLACGEMGVGAMADVNTIVEVVRDVLDSL
jgi:phosphopantothenoylcysteine decarboxylase